MKSQDQRRESLADSFLNQIQLHLTECITNALISFGIRSPKSREIHKFLHLKSQSSIRASTRKSDKLDPDIDFRFSLKSFLYSFDEDHIPELTKISHHFCASASL